MAQLLNDKQMGWFELNSRITIGDPNDSAEKAFKPLSGVHEVKINRSMFNVNETVLLALPGLTFIKPKDGGEPKRIHTSAAFKDGDLIKIELGYNGELREEFTGFVKRRGKGEPCVIECEGYARQLRLKVSVTADYTKKDTTAKKLLELACQGTDITVECPVDFPISGITLNKADGIRIIDYIKEASDHTLTIFFKSPKVLWCGLVYTAYATSNGDANVFGLPTVSYRLGYNVPRNNGLAERVPSEPVHVIFNNRLATGQQIMTAGKYKSAKRHLTSLMKHIPSESAMKSFAVEKEYKYNYTGFDGKLTSFLNPYCKPGYDAYINDSRYPELKGTYVIEGVQTTFGLKGARRVMDIGPRVGFDK